MTILGYSARKIKGNGFTIDEEIKFAYLANMSFSMFCSLVRGMLKTIGVKKSSLVFVGKNTKVKCKSKITVGYGLNIGKYVVIDALSRDGIKIGNRVKIGDYTRILCTGTIRNIGVGISIGDNCGIAEYCFFGAAGGIKIGNDVIMGQNVRFHAENHNFDKVDTLIRLQGVSQKGIEVKNNCWIGSGAVILDGVTIGEGCVIAANSVVTKDIPDFSIAAGMPAKVIKSRV